MPIKIVKNGLKKGLSSVGPIPKDPSFTIKVASVKSPAFINWEAALQKELKKTPLVKHLPLIAKTGGSAKELADFQKNYPEGTKFELNEYGDIIAVFHDQNLPDTLDMPQSVIKHTSTTLNTGEDVQTWAISEKGKPWTPHTSRVVAVRPNNGDSRFLATVGTAYPLEVMDRYFTTAEAGAGLMEDWAWEVLTSLPYEFWYWDGEKK
jgi:hypothetical protein